MILGFAKVLFIVELLDLINSDGESFTHLQLHDELQYWW
jgi:hypothetical protein